MQFIISGDQCIEVWDAAAAAVVEYADRAAAVGVSDVVAVPTFSKEGAATTASVVIGAGKVLSLLPAPPDEFEDVPADFVAELRRRQRALPSR